MKDGVFKRFIHRVFVLIVVICIPLMWFYGESSLYWWILSGSFIIAAALDDSPPTDWDRTFGVKWNG